MQMNFSRSSGLNVAWESSQLFSSVIRGSRDRRQTVVRRSVDRGEIGDCHDISFDKQIDKHRSIPFALTFDQAPAICDFLQEDPHWKADACGRALSTYTNLFRLGEWPGGHSMLISVSPMSRAESEPCPPSSRSLPGPPISVSSPERPNSWSSPALPEMKSASMPPSSRSFPVPP